MNFGISLYLSFALGDDHASELVHNQYIQIRTTGCVTKTLLEKLQYRASGLGFVFQRDSDMTHHNDDVCRYEITGSPNVAFAVKYMVTIRTKLFTVKENWPIL